MRSVVNGTTVIRDLTREREKFSGESKDTETAGHGRNTLRGLVRTEMSVQ